MTQGTQRTRRVGLLLAARELAIVLAIALAGCRDRHREAALERLGVVVAEQAAADAACTQNIAAPRPDPKQPERSVVQARADVAFDCREKRQLQLERYQGLLTMVPNPAPGEIPPFPAVPAAVDAAPDDGDGHRLFVKHKCATCHSIDGSAGVGDSMRGLYGTTVRHTDGSSAVVDDAYLRESIVRPDAKLIAGQVPTMPSYAGKLNDATVDVLVSYIRSLSAR